MNLDQALQTFVAESRELLEDMESALLAVGQAESRAEPVNAIFRAAHTIKGSAGLFGLDHIVAFTHAVESVLDEVREARIEVTGQLLALLLSCRDHLSRLIDTVAAGRLEADDAMSEAAAPLVRQLREVLGTLPEAGLPVADVRGQAHAGTFERIEGSGSGASDYWHISLRFGPDVLRNGMDPMSFIRYLGTIGRIVGIATLADAMPADETMDPERCYLGFEIAFHSETDKASIENVFEFVRDDCRLCILPPHSKISEYVKLIHELPEEVPRLGEILIRCGSVTAGDLEHALAEQAAAKPQQRLGEILVEQGAVPGVVVDAAIAKQQHVSDQFRARETRSIRVDADKLDHLINLIGELIIASASANLVARRARNDELQEAASTLSSLVEEVRDGALQLRMVKIGASFNRFQRVVHDVSREIGKDIRLVVSGEETELDKTVIEKIADPLTHLVRNAMDHGIEPAELRAARGKPAQGTVRLNAYHDSGSIVIEVGDDGGGLKRDKILARAVERGLVEPGRSLSDAEICNLIFEPGFSTADKVTKLSGRGVGMDVVKRNITALRGTVEVQSEEGVGSKVIVRLPLTLAIINGFLVGLGGSTFVIPQDMIEECIEFSSEVGHDYTNLRGEVLPFIRLRELFGAGGSAGRRESIVVVNYAGKKAGLVVDTLLGEFQTVIKPMGKMFANLRCISGSTILGNGEVALILDVPMLVQEVANQSTQAA
ncbi:chemotaxis protein CheA [Noviherbaspirillum sp.]|uniref:chemotaxis protein CheA n=1 Tax=Noviherbaspirillum sp. TaxID=1926288 RepID=UPI002B45A55D|nr:chemotaxis protein CheA [Noviherbaspirillum sp.]HJV82005.1 chemotaxis protein CheA [Noviherbaspirillum sp.]